MVKGSDIFIFFSAVYKLLKNKLILLLTVLLFSFIYISLFYNKCYSYSISPLEKYYATICYPDKYKFFHFLNKWSPREVFIYQRWKGDNFYFGLTKPIYKSEVLNLMDSNVKWDLDNNKIIIDNKILEVNINEYCKEIFTRSCRDDYSYLDNYDINEVKKNKPNYHIGDGNSL